MVTLGLSWTSTSAHRMFDASKAVKRVRRELAALIWVDYRKKGRGKEREKEEHTKSPCISLSEEALAIAVNAGDATGGVASFSGSKSVKNFSTGEGPKKVEDISELRKVLWKTQWETGRGVWRFTERRGWVGGVEFQQLGGDSACEFELGEYIRSRAGLFEGELGGSGGIWCTCGHRGLLENRGPAGEASFKWRHTSFRIEWVSRSKRVAPRIHLLAPPALCAKSIPALFTANELESRLPPVGSCDLRPNARIPSAPTVWVRIAAPLICGWRAMVDHLLSCGHWQKN